jgi:hypothetical protein
MSKPNYQPSYRFETPDDTLIVPEPVIPGNDQPNSYGPVVYNRGEMRLRESGGVWSVWKGALMVGTYLSVTAPY